MEHNGTKRLTGYEQEKNGQGKKRILHHLMSVTALHTDFYPIIFIFSLACMDARGMDTWTGLERILRVTIHYNMFVSVFEMAHKVKYIKASLKL